MQLTLSQSHLQRLTRGLAKIIPARGSVMPALDHVRFRRIGENNAEATGTNLDETLTLALPGTATADSGPDAFLCPIDELRRLAKDMGRGDAAMLAALPGEPPRLDLILRTFPTPAAAGIWGFSWWSSRRGEQVIEGDVKRA
jgi:hypothetical protein